LKRIIGKNNGKAILKFAYSNNRNKNKQNENVDAFLKSKVDVLAISLVDVNDNEYKVPLFP